MAVPTRSHAIRVPPSKGPWNPPFQTFARSIQPSFQRPTAPSSSVLAKQLKRSSSIYSRATRCWDDQPIRPDESPPPPVPRLPFLGDKKFSESSPELSSADVSPLTPDLQETLPQLLEPRTYQPLLLSPSPSIGPSSLRQRSSGITTISALLSRDDKERILARRSSDEIQLSLSPPPITPILNHSNSISSIGSSTGPEVISTLPPKHTRGPSNESAPAATLSKPFECLSTDSHWRANSINKALSHMRLGSDVTRAFITPLQTSEQVPMTGHRRVKASEETLLSDYRDKLIDEYRELAPPPTGRWQDDSTEQSDPEATAREIKMIPEPLFWENRQKELYPQRAMYAQQKQKGKQGKDILRHPPTKKHKKKRSLPSVPLQMILPSQYRRKSVEEQEDSPTTVTLKKALALRLTSKKREDDRASVESALRLFHGKPISTPIQHGPMPLQLPKIAYRDVEAKKPTLASCSKEHAKPQYTWRSSEDSSADRESTPTTPWPSRLKEKDAKRTSDSHASSSLHTDSSFSGPQKADRSPSPRHMAHLPPLPSPRLSSIFHKAKASPSSSKRSSFDSKKGYKRDKSHDSVSSFDRNAVSAFSPVDDDRRSMRPAIFDKALEVMQERDRDKRRKELKSRIKFVGRVDPEKINQEQEKPRRETFGEGWI